VPGRAQAEEVNALWTGQAMKLLLEPASSAVARAWGLDNFLRPKRKQAVDHA